MRTLTRPRCPRPRSSSAHLPWLLLHLGEQQDWAAESLSPGLARGADLAVTANLGAGQRVILEAGPPDGRPRADLGGAPGVLAVPGLYPPVRIDGARLVDGRIRSAADADIAAKLRSGPWSS